MSNFPTLDDIEAELLKGRGIVVIVEGETYADDAYFYRAWFGSISTQITFFPQDGWKQVRQAVEELRKRMYLSPVYGIVDRDFLSTASLSAEKDSTGIIRTKRYTLENYLLDPAILAKVFRSIFRRYSPLGQEWADPLFVANKIEQAYRDCLPLASHNYVVHVGDEIRGSNQSLLTRKFIESNQADLSSIEQKLRSWGQQLGAAQDLGNLYRKTLLDLEKGNISNWQERVTGKAVLSALWQQIPNRPRTGKIKYHDLINEYANQNPEVPDDLEELIQKLLL